MQDKTCRSAVLTLLTVSAAFTWAAQAESAPEPTPAPISAGAMTASVEPPAEVGLGALELVTGVAMGAGGIGAAVAIADWEWDGSLALAGGALLALPALQGLVICGIGGLSPHYQDTCGWSIGGAYLGAIAAFPIGFLAGNPSDGPLEGAVAVIAGVGLGVLIGAPIGATWAWNAQKERRVTRRGPAASVREASHGRRFPGEQPTALGRSPFGPRGPHTPTFRVLSIAF